AAELIEQIVDIDKSDRGYVEDTQAVSQIDIGLPVGGDRVQGDQGGIAAEVERAVITLQQGGGDRPAQIVDFQADAILRGLRGAGRVDVNRPRRCLVLQG